jgi:hypothetical protein
VIIVAEIEKRQVKTVVAESMVCNRVCRALGVPCPNSFRINSPRFAAPEVHHQPFQNVIPASQVHPTHPASIVQMVIPPLQFLAALS